MVQYQAGWYPTHDPTWYGPVSILLGVLEIHAASACASIPIFWPILSPYLSMGGIFVTHEIDIEVQELTTHGATNGDRKDGSQSSFGSETKDSKSRSSSKTDLVAAGKQGAASPDKDNFLEMSVHPFDGPRPQTSLVRSESSRRDSRWWRL
jgi:hypothetical protein